MNASFYSLFEIKCHSKAASNADDPLDVEKRSADGPADDPVPPFMAYMMNKRSLRHRSGRSLLNMYARSRAMNPVRRGFGNLNGLGDESYYESYTPRQLPQTQFVMYEKRSRPNSIVTPSGRDSETSIGQLMTNPERRSDAADYFYI